MTEEMCKDNATPASPMLEKLYGAIYQLEKRVQCMDGQQQVTVLDYLSSILRMDIPALADFKEPHPVKSKVWQEGNKRLPTALEYLKTKWRKPRRRNRSASEQDSGRLRQTMINQNWRRLIKFLYILDISKSITMHSEHSKHSFQIVRCLTMLSSVSRFQKLQHTIVDGIALDPSIPGVFVTGIYNPKAVGDCGFRAVGWMLKSSEIQWWMIKADCQDLYFHYDTSLAEDIFDCRDSSCSWDYWCLSPDCPQILDMP